MTTWAVIGVALTLVLSIWKYYSSKNHELKKRIDDARELVEQGINENNPSKVTAGFDRLRSDS